MGQQPNRYLILETKGFGPLIEVKQQAARRWVNSLQADDSCGRWYYAMARTPEDVRRCNEETALLE